MFLSTIFRFQTFQSCGTGKIISITCNIVHYVCPYLKLGTIYHHNHCFCCMEERSKNSLKSYMLIDINCPLTVRAKQFDVESKGPFLVKNVSHAWFHTALIWCGAQWECEGVPGTGIKSAWLQHTTVSLRQQWVADMLMDDVWKCEKEISHRQELAGVLFSRSISNGFLIRVKPS